VGNGIQFGYQGRTLATQSQMGSLFDAGTIVDYSQALSQLNAIHTALPKRLSPQLLSLPHA
jgi:hypothetical protein